VPDRAVDTCLVVEDAREKSQQHYPTRRSRQKHIKVYKIEKTEPRCSVLQMQVLRSSKRLQTYSIR